MLQGNKYNLISSEGLEIGQEYNMTPQEEKEFSLIFPPIPSNLTSINYSEGDYENAWNFFGIQLTNKPLKVNLPKGFKDVTIDKNAVLPPVEFKIGKARLEGQILNYCDGMPVEVSVRVSYPFGSTGLTFPIDIKGKFSGEIDVFSTHPATIYFMRSGTPCFIASGETTSIVLNTAEKSRRESRFADNRPSLGEPVYYGGYLASLSKEFANVDRSLYMRQLNTQESIISYLQSIGDKTPEALKAFFWEEYQEKRAILEMLEVSPACKQIINCILDLSYTDDLIYITSWIDDAYIYNNQLQGDREAINKYYASRKFIIPDDFYNVLRDFPLINNPQMLYTQEAVSYASKWQYQNMQPVLSKALGTDHGTLFDIMKMTGMYNSIQEFEPVNEEDIEQLPAVYQELIRNKNNELLQLIEINKSKTGYTVHDVEKVVNENVFSSIISKFKGKPILLDFWATWCGPCKRANEEMKSLKEELSDNDIVYVFVANDNSPVETWKNMIPDLHGEHFRLSAAQWSYIEKTFDIKGVPTYFFIDREGNIKEKIVGYHGIQKMKEGLHNLLNETQVNR